MTSAEVQQQLYAEIDKLSVAAQAILLLAAKRIHSPTLNFGPIATLNIPPSENA